MAGNKRRYLVRIFAECTYEQAFYTADIMAATQNAAWRKGRKLVSELAKTLEGRTRGYEITILNPDHYGVYQSPKV
jgi:hypothetical protein